MHVVDGLGMVWGSIRKEDERIRQDAVRMMGDYVGPGESPYTRYDAAITERTIEWLANRAAADDQRPWRLYIGLVAPHHPLVAPQEFYDMYPLDQLGETKLHPRDGHKRHPWASKIAEAHVGEEGWTNETERRSAIAAYYGLTSWMDHNVGRIMSALKEAGYFDDTTVIYSSDHGENLGVRGLWGKFNLYQESVAVPLIVAPAPSAAAACPATKGAAVSLLDISETIIEHFGADLPGERPGRSLYEITSEDEDPERIAFSEYHASGSVSGGFMIRQGP